MLKTAFIDTDRKIVNHLNSSEGFQDNCYEELNQVMILLNRYLIQLYQLNCATIDHRPTDKDFIRGTNRDLKIPMKLNAAELSKGRALYV